MAILLSQTPTSAHLSVSGRFTFADSSEFRKQLISALAGSIKSMAIDLADVTFMDSSGLGMLMVAQKECQQRNISLQLLHPKGDVKNLLVLTKSYERFSIAE
ncbi:MAG: anti-sigma factor antagonist [Alphaproteobacteria bacterium]|nr:anti-sigma factor antagonist [Alphaproteobacteria bacterium]